MPLVRSQVNSQLTQSVHQMRPNFPAFDSTYFLSHAFWLLISFGLFYVFIAKVIVPLVGEILEIRRDRIASDLDNAARLKSEAEDLLLQSNEIMHTAMHQFKATILEARENAKNVAENIRKESQERFASLLHDCAVHSAKIKEEGYSSIGEIAKEITPFVVHAIIKQDVDFDVAATAVQKNLANKSKL